MTLRRRPKTVLNSQHGNTLRSSANSYLPTGNLIGKIVSMPNPSIKKGNETERRGKGKPDLNQLAYSVVQQATGQIEKPKPKEKNPAAVSLGRLGGLKGGKARAEKLTAKKRSEIARKAAEKRWGS
jgi:hypothetical protein